jgi:ferrous iron transport protein A
MLKQVASKPQGDRPEETPTPLPLGDIEVGQQVILAKIQAPRRLQHRLAEMGLRPGVRFTLLNRGRPGPFILGIKDTRLVLGHGMNERVFVYRT